MTREQEIAYAKEHGIPVPVENGSPYSTDENLWGRSIECGVLEDPRIGPPEEVFEWTSSPMAAPEEPAYTTIRFEAGKPVAMDGKREDFASIIVSLNELAGRPGGGGGDHPEAPRAGGKAPAGDESPPPPGPIKGPTGLGGRVPPPGR